MLVLLQETSAKDLHYELTPFLYNNTALFIKVRRRHRPSPDARRCTRGKPGHVCLHCFGRCMSCD